MIQKIWDKVRFPLLLQVGMLAAYDLYPIRNTDFSFFANAIAVPAASAAFSMALALIWLPAGFFHKIIACFFQVVLWISEQDYGRIIVGHVPGIWVIIGYFVLYFVCGQTKPNPDPYSGWGGICEHFTDDGDPCFSQERVGFS